MVLNQTQVIIHVINSPKSNEEMVGFLGIFELPRFGSSCLMISEEPKDADDDDDLRGVQEGSGSRELLNSEVKIISNDIKKDTYEDWLAVTRKKKPMLCRELAKKESNKALVDDSNMFHGL